MEETVRTAFIILFALCIVIFGLGIWTNTAEKQAHIMPSAEKISIEELTLKPEWNAADLELLSDQTGLSREALLYLEEIGRKGG